MTLRELRERRDTIVREMRSIHDKAAGESRDLNDQEQSRFTELRSDLDRAEQAVQRQEMIDDADRRAAGQPITGSGDDRFDAEVRNFSLTRAIASMVPEIAGNVDAGREREISQEIARRSGRAFKGIAVPLTVFEKRVTTTTSGGSNIIATDFKGDQFIDTLRANLITGRLGATVLSGLSGNVAIPKRSGSVSASWVSENQALTFSDQNFEQVTMEPKHCGAITELSRNMIIQSSPDVEELTRRDMAEVLARAIDAAAILGDGTGPNPRGILNVSGIGTSALSNTPTWAEVLAFLGDLEDSNNEGTGWAMHPKARRVFKGTLKEAADAGAGYLMGDDNRLAGYGSVASTALPTNLGTGTNETPVVFGRWSDLLIGYWSAFDLLVNPYETTAYSKGNIQVRAMLTADVAVRRPESFTSGNLVVA